MIFRLSLVLLVCIASACASAEQLIVDSFGPMAEAPAWKMQNASLNRADGSGARLAPGQSSLSYVSVDVEEGLEGRRLSIVGEICCDIDPNSTNVWATFYKGEESMVTFHGMPVGLNKEGEVLSILVPAYPGATMVRIGVFNSSDKDVLLRRFSASSVEAASVTPTNRVSEIADLISRKSVYLSDEDGKQRQDFMEYAMQLAASVDTGAKDEQLIAALLKYAGDTHSRYLGGPSNQLGSPLPSAPLLPRSTVVGSVGYVEVPGTMAATPESVRDFHEELIKVLSEFEGRDLKSLVVDLRRNSGGNMWPAICALQPMLPAEFGYFLYPDGKKVSWTEISGQIAPLLVANGDCAKEKAFVAAEVPLYVLLSGETASAGEAIAIALLSRPGSVSAGSPTMGLTSANEPVTLTDGSTVVVAASWMAGRDGIAKKGPLIPERQVQLPADYGTQEQDVEKIVRLLETTEPRSR